MYVPLVLAFTSQQAEGGLAFLLLWVVWTLCFLLGPHSKTGGDEGTGCQLASPPAIGGRPAPGKKQVGHPPPSCPHPALSPRAGGGTPASTLACDTPGPGTREARRKVSSAPSLVTSRGSQRPLPSFRRYSTRTGWRRRKGFPPSSGSCRQPGTVDFPGTVVACACWRFLLPRSRAR